jgi:Cu-Zn family superoxide dismutase
MVGTEKEFQTMKNTPIRTALLAGTIAGALMAPAFAQQEMTPTGTASATLAGEGIEGTVTFTETPTGILIVEIQATGVPEGPHGVHFHETGSCDAEGGHESAGGHVAGESQHGVLNPEGPHPGDLPNVHVQQDGVLHAEFFVHDLTIAGDGDNALMDDDGAAFILHAGADDYTTDPAGDSGDRIACGVIEAAT